MSLNEFLVLFLFRWGVLLPQLAEIGKLFVRALKRILNLLDCSQKLFRAPRRRLWSMHTILMTIFPVGAFYLLQKAPELR